MEQNLKKFLQNYNEITIKLIEDIKLNKYDSVEELFKDRQEIIEKLKGLNYSAQEIRSVVVELKLQENEKKLNEVLNNEKNLLQNKMIKIKKGKNASHMYNRGFSPDAVYIYKKI